MKVEPRTMTEARHPDTEDLDRLCDLDIVSLMNAEDAKVVEAVQRVGPFIAKVIELAANSFGRGGRLIYVGAGTSGRLGVLDASECPPTFGTPPEMVVGIIAGGSAALTRSVEDAEDSAEDGAAEIDRLEVGERDVVVGIATSGRTPFVLGAIQRAAERKAATVGIACNQPSLMGGLVDVEIAVLVGPEILAGSTRLKAGTATKMILNMISTGAMIRVGKTYGNRMIDLRPTNEKLRLRARRILSEVAGLDEGSAIALLSEASGRLKPAVVAAVGRMSVEQADRLLAECGGQVREAIERASRR